MGESGVVLACFRVGEAMRVVAELGHGPGAEDDAQAGLAGVDVSVPAAAKIASHHLAQLLDLGVQRADQGNLPGHDGGVGGLDRRRLAQLRRPQDRLDLRGPDGRAAAVGPAQRGADPRL